MLKREFTCQTCNKQVRFPFIRISNIITCPHCQTKYVIIKNSVASFALSFLWLFIAFTFVDSQLSLHAFTVLLVLVMVWALDIISELIFVYIIRWKNYIRIEKK